MPQHVTAVHQSAPALLVPFLLMIIVCCRPCQTLCESRCERAVPDLGQLRTVWHRSFRWVAGRSISFEHFLLTLTRNPDESIRNLVLDVIGRFEECMVACEHMFSKRSTSTQRPRPLRSRLRIKRLKTPLRSRSSSRPRSKLIVLLRRQLFVKM
ncbi:hypothetical protein ElyMa_005917000 [Elysia marginata]|uniref:Secreted protein n=1 Tax=Elysia marginata TaxID=1093978 RepID=A0AAV4G768_9GAST|nr:hypothetical protein ElyMa_005917000 [Elysia marginata]